MKKIYTSILLFLGIIYISAGLQTTYAAPNSIDDVRIGTQIRDGNHAKNNSALESLGDTYDTDFFSGYTFGAQGAYNLVVRIAKDLKNLFFVLATLFFLTIVFRLIFTENTEEESEKYKKGMIWVTVGIVVMQVAYSFVRVLFDKDVGGTLATSFVEDIIYPLIAVLETAASFLFLGIAIYAFFKVATANGDAEKVKTGWKTIIYGLIGRVIIRFSRQLVEATYGSINCTNANPLFSKKCLDGSEDLSGFSEIIVTIINWMNSFVGIVVIIMIIYAGIQVLFGFGDEEKLKKAKTAIFYIAIGIAILVLNYLLLTFFILPEKTI